MSSSLVICFQRHSSFLASMQRRVKAASSAPLNLSTTFAGGFFPWARGDKTLRRRSL